jgi:hypothetical protein
MFIFKVCVKVFNNSGVLNLTQKKGNFLILELQKAL